MYSVGGAVVETKSKALEQLQAAIVRCQRDGFDLVVMPMWDCGRQHTVLMLRDVTLTDGRLIDLSKEAGDE